MQDDERASEERPLQGRVILVVQRRWLIARQLGSLLEAKGARALLANSAASGHSLTDVPELCAAVVDSDSAELCHELDARGVPYVLYTGREQAGDECAEAPLVRKPAGPEQVATEVERLLQPAAG
jgi:hypothetical protein